ncbi:MAG: IS630 family transposase [Dehalococcoidia bacterium]|nr:IS630 family transposase [Dehalococcoidia bacterium]
MGRATEFRLRAGDREQLERLVRKPGTTRKVCLRADILLAGAAGKGVRESARELKTTTPTVMLWKERYLAGGLEAVLTDAPRPGRPRQVTAEKVAEVVERTTREKPVGATHWSTRTLAPVVGLSHTQVHRIWRAHGLKPHREETFKVSTDPNFLSKLEDVVGLYLDPPEKAVVFSVDEKSQIQALDRTQPGLPMKKGRAGTKTHDYKRHGTTTLFAALNIATGEVIAECMGQHRHDEFLLFLKQLDRKTPRELDLEVIVDNYATHKHAHVQAWLAAHPRVHLHFTPTSASWLNLVERLFAELTDKAIRRGVFTSVRALEQAITAYLDERNRQPRPYTWTATVEAILSKVGRAQSALATVKDSSVPLH